MRYLPVYRFGEVVATAIVDDDDWGDVSGKRWYLHKDGYAYRQERVGSRKRPLMLHRYLLGLDWGDPRHCDHINRNTLDNRRENLRFANKRLNAQNQGPRKGSSRFRGVLWCGGKWRASVMLDGKRHHLGYFELEEDAAKTAAAFRAEHMPYSSDAALAAQEAS